VMKCLSWLSFRHRSENVLCESSSARGRQELLTSVLIDSAMMSILKSIHNDVHCDSEYATLSWIRVSQEAHWYLINAPVIICRGGRFP
jgi:hypothetical protein